MPHGPLRASEPNMAPASCRSPAPGSRERPAEADPRRGGTRAAAHAFAFAFAATLWYGIALPLVLFTAMFGLPGPDAPANTGIQHRRQIWLKPLLPPRDPFPGHWLGRPGPI